MTFLAVADRWIDASIGNVQHYLAALRRTQGAEFLFIDFGLLRGCVSLHELLPWSSEQ